MTFINLPSFLSKFGSSKNRISPVVLISLDGWGLAPPSHGNAIALASTPNMNNFYAKYPHGELIASGESVGLPAGEVGNSEVGHLTMGVGRVIYQSLKRINMSIEDGSFYTNKALDGAMQHVLKNGSNLHIMGLVGSGNVHSNTEHLYAILQYCKKSKVQNVYLHLFTDGRDAPPTDGVNVMTQIVERMRLMKLGKIATVSGRYYAMDRDARWNRIQRAYNAIVSGKGATANDPVEAMKKSYASGITDEFVEPTVILHDGKAATVSNNDACIFFNFRVDRARELTMSLILPNFEQIKVEDFGFQIDRSKKEDDVDPNKTFAREKIVENLYFVSMTEYNKSFPVSGVAFPPQYNFPDSLPEIFSKHNIPSFHLAESEKERMVTYYFRGMSSKAFPGEEVDIVSSPKVETYDKKPEMSAEKITKELKLAVSRNKYGFIVMNFANPDMVAHSGDMKATIKAIETVDKMLGEIAKFVLDRNGVILISADHGNAEELLSFPMQSFYYTTDKGLKNTDHSSNPVPIIIIANSLRDRANMLLRGTLADIAPTILAIMKLPVPATMAGNNLLATSSLGANNNE
jgi:2,3-bisphosphoglycerate-independent phosphoglycerate mutase